MSTPRITFRQSLANTVDREILTTLLSEHPHLTEVYIQHEFLQGFGPTRVHLAQPTFKTTARNSWILKIGPRNEIKAECQGHAGWCYRLRVAEAQRAAAATGSLEGLLQQLGHSLTTTLTSMSDRFADALSHWCCAR